MQLFAGHIQPKEIVNLQYGNYVSLMTEEESDDDPDFLAAIEAGLLDSNDNKIKDVVNYSTSEVVV